MLNRKFLTKLLGSKFRARTIAQHAKLVESKALGLKQYATYVVDKHSKERNMSLSRSREACYGYSPIDVLAYVARDGSIKKSLFEFNTVNHFLAAGDYGSAVEAVACILAQLVHENKKCVACFDIDKIDADAKKAEAEYMKQREQEAAAARASQASEPAALSAAAQHEGTTGG